MNEIGQLVSTLGFPIVLVGALLWFFYKCVWKELVQTNLERLDRITETNQVLVQTNADLIKSMDVKIDGMHRDIQELKEELK